MNVSVIADDKKHWKLNWIMGAMWLQGVGFSILAFASFLLTMSILGAPMGAMWVSSLTVGLIMAANSVKEAIEVWRTGPVKNERMFGMYKTVSLISSLVPVAALLTPVVRDAMTAMGISLVAVIICAIANLGESIVLMRVRQEVKDES